MKKLVRLFILTILIGCTKNTEKIVPSVTDITESVYTSVTIQPDSLYQVYAAVSGILDKNLVEEGDSIQIGDPILQIINSTPKLNSENARLALALAKENYSGRAAILGGIEDEILAAKLTLQNDSVNYFRQKNLWEQNIGAKAEYDNRKLAYELSQNKLKLLQSRYERTENELQTQLNQAANNYRTSQITNQDFTVTSKIHGKVYALNKNPGEVVTTMDPLASVGSADVFVVEMLVDEVDIVKLRIGQKALITLDAYHNEVFEAKVSKIYPKKDERSQTFKVEALFENPPKVLYPGLAGEGNIIVAQKKDALIIPKTYLIDENKVLVEKDTVEVVTGLQDLEYVEILQGIDAKTVLLNPNE